jgi:hypothetical protein
MQPASLTRIAGAALALLLGACATTESPAPAAATTPAEKTAKAADEVAQAVTAPLADLNLVRAEIPPILLLAQKLPYGPPADPTCAGLAKQIEALDAVLGADLDTAQTAVNPSLIERGLDSVGGAAIGTIRGTTQAVVPYRSWVRRLSGAERYSKDVSAAIAAGTIRRAYLKGFGQAQGCSAPAAPRR